MRQHKDLEKESKLKKESIVTKKERKITPLEILKGDSPAQGKECTDNQESATKHFLDKNSTDTESVVLVCSLIYIIVTND